MAFPNETDEMILLFCDMKRLCKLTAQKFPLRNHTTERSYVGLTLFTFYFC